MSTARARVAGVGLDVTIRVDDDLTKKALRDARRKLRRDVRQIVTDAGDEIVKPEARRLAGRLRTKKAPIAGTLVVKPGSGNSAFLTSTLPMREHRAVGLLEFGGTRRDVIEPKGRSGAKAILTPRGPRARVAGPRVYTGRLFMTRAVKAKAGPLADAATQRVLAAFDPLPHS